MVKDTGKMVKFTFATNKVIKKSKLSWDFGMDAGALCMIFL